MGVLGTYTARTLKKNPVRTAVTVVGIVLATALILAVITSALSLYTYLVNAEMSRNGSYNGMVDGITAQQLQDVQKATGVTGVAALELDGYALVNEVNSLTPYVAIEGLVPGATADLADLAALVVEKGRMPQDATEILLPATLVRSGVLDADLGDTVTFDVGTRVDADGVQLFASTPTMTSESGELLEHLANMTSRSFTVCGLYADSNPLFWTSEYGGDVAGLPAITVASPLDQAPADARYQAWISVSDPAQTGSIIQRALNYESVSMRTNGYINRLTSVSLAIGGYQTLVGFTVLVLGAVVVSSLLLVRTSFSISVSERTRQFGLLSSVGATRRQLRGMVMREALVLSLVAIPLGILIGYAGTAVVLNVCRDLVADLSMGLLGTVSSRADLHVVVSIPVIAASALLALGTTLVSAWGPARRASRMSAMDAIRSSNDVRIPEGVRRSGRLAQKVFGIEGGIAAKSFKRAKKPRRATIAALVTGTTLVATAALLGAYVTEVLVTAKPEAVRSYDIRYWFSDYNISGADDKKASPQEVIDRLAACEGVTEAISGVQVITMTDLDAPAAQEAYTAAFKEYFSGNLNATVMFMDDEDFRAWLNEAGIDAAPYFDDTPRAVAINRFNGMYADRYIQIEPFTGEPFTFEGATEVASDSGLANAPDPWESRDESSSDWHGISFEVTGFTQKVPWCVGDVSQPLFILPLSMMGSVDPSLVADDDHAYYNRFWELRVRSDDPAATEIAMTAQLNALGLSPTRLYNMTSSTAGIVSLFSTAQVFIWAFAVIVTLIAVTSAFNTMVTSVGLRRREFAVLRSIGLTKGGLYKMLACECLMYSVRVLLWSIPVACLMSLGLWYVASATASTVTYQIPWIVLPAALGAFVVVCAATAYAAHSVDATSPVEALRSETS